jgi:hypothetical protein
MTARSALILGFAGTPLLRATKNQSNFHYQAGIVLRF